MKFYIELDNPSLTYIGGQTVSGNVNVELDIDEMTSGLTLRCLGNAEAHSSDRHTLNQNLHDLENTITTHGGIDHHVTQNTITKHHTARETYFEYDIVLFGQSGGPEIRMPAGPQLYPFTFELPAGLPSSFLGSHGVVQYYLDAKIRRPSKFDYNTKSTFEVIGQLDLNVYPGAAEPAEIRKERNSGCLCCKRGPLGFSLKMMRTGFVCGDMLQFTANLYNMSSKSIPKTCIRIVQDASFHAGGSTKCESIILLEVPGPVLEAGETKIWEEKSIEIPFMPPTKLGGSAIIGLEYFIKMVVSVSGGADLTGSIPIVIGTTAFQAHLFEGLVSALNSTAESLLGSKNTSKANSVANTSVTPSANLG